MIGIRIWFGRTGHGDMSLKKTGPSTFCLNLFNIWSSACRYHKLLARNSLPWLTHKISLSGHGMPQDGSLSLKSWANVNHCSYYVYSIQHRMTATEGLIASTSALSSVGETAKPLFYLHNNKPWGSVYEVWKLRSHHENHLVPKEPPHNDPENRQLQY